MNKGVLTLCNTLSLEIEIKDDENVSYQFSNETEKHDAKIDWYDDIENVTGYANEDLSQPGFKINDTIYFLGEFLRI